MEYVYKRIERQRGQETSVFQDHPFNELSTNEIKPSRIFRVIRIDVRCRSVFVPEMVDRGDEPR